ncbi:hypothetical protein [Lysobacter gummosus]|nr:hypothetical protein LG3211_4300 [Lysobacter gummosus]
MLEIHVGSPGMNVLSRAVALPGTGSACSRSEAYRTAPTLPSRF